MTPQINWAGNYTYRAPRFHRPETIEQLQELVAGSDRTKALGSRHCFNDIADTAGDLIDLTALPAEVVTHDGLAVVNPAMRYGRLAPVLHLQGRALSNLASLPHISVAGAIATGTHGSGVTNQGLASAIAAFDLVRADGELVTVNRGDADFDGMVVGLGALGILTSARLDTVPTFGVRQDVFDNLPWAELEANFDAIGSCAYSVSVFTDWRSSTVSQVWCKSRIDDATESAVFDPTGAVQRSFFGATPATEARHPLPGIDGGVCTPQLGVPGPWYDRLPHFQLAFTPSNGNEVQTEYFLPADRAQDAIATLRQHGAEMAPLLQVSEIRRIAADDLWLSPAYQRDSVAFHFTWINDEQRVRTLLADVIEPALAPFEPRPHWGKIFSFDAAALAQAYPRLAEFRSLAERLDPNGVFDNAFLERSGAR